MPPCGINHPRTCAAIKFGHDVYARSPQIARGLCHIIVIAENRDLLTCRHAPAVHISPHSPRHHHTGAVVIWKRNRPLKRARAKHRPLRHDPPETGPRKAHTTWRKITDPLQRPKCALVISARHRRPRHDPHVWHRGELRLDGLYPVHRGRTVNLFNL